MAQTYSDKPTLEAWNALVDAIGSAPKIAWGTYAGTGAYGENNRSSLTFDFEPKLVVVQMTNFCAFNQDPGLGGVPLIAVRGLGLMYSGGTNFVSLFWEGNTLSWFSRSGANYQYNVVATNYVYFAIG